MRRRDFIQLSAASMTIAADTACNFDSALARGPIERSGPPRFQVGLAAYSLRDYFAFKKGKSQKQAADGKPIDMVGFLDYCVDNEFDAAELSSYFFQPDANDTYFRDLKREAFTRGITISGTAIGNNFTVGKGPNLDREIELAIAWIDRAALLGAPHIRFFAGTGQQLAQNPQRLDEAAGAINQCAKHAANKGIFLGVENHGKLTADQMIQIMERIDSPWVGINLDTGNFVSDDPYADLQRCIPYAVNVQVKVSMRNPAGEQFDADLPRIGKILKDAGYQGFVILEYEDEKPYKNIPDAHRELRAALA
ncbi:MAG: sugar phosphate isomerase/epimerase [Pirellulaceae bacterium]|nr:sugar phosphate isomerase/epimerase [Pirellulaceae bacterium]